MADALAFENQEPEALTNLILPRIESHLQMMWIQTEWVDAAAVNRIDAPLRRFVNGLLSPGQSISPSAVVNELRRQLSSFFGRCLDQSTLVDDEVMTPIVRRFGAAMLELARLSELSEPLEILLGIFEQSPCSVDRELVTRLRNEVHHTVATSEDQELTRSNVRDRLYNLREALRASSGGVGTAIAGLDRVLDDVG